jgi:uncharacterized protein (DUF1330 family)
MSAIKPNKEQFVALAAAAKTNEGTVVMLNLLKYARGGGAREYGAYGDSASKMVKALGGRIIYMGRCDQVLIGDDAANDWDAIAVVEYPNRQAFIDMVSKPDYQKASEHRDAGLERTVLIATTPVTAVSA